LCLSHSQVLLFGRLYPVHSFASTTQINTTRQVLDVHDFISVIGKANELHACQI